MLMKLNLNIVCVRALHLLLLMFMYMGLCCPSKGLDHFQLFLVVRGTNISFTQLNLLVSKGEVILLGFSCTLL